MAATISVEVLAETRKMRSGIDSAVGQLGKLNRAAKSSGPVLKGVLGASFISSGINLALSGLTKLTSVIGDSVAEARESQKVGAVTAQIIKSTGGAAKLSADQVGDLSTAISNKTGIDDEAIQSGANLLLTFKNVRNEVGKGNQIFTRATAAAADLSAAGFGSIESSSKMLGKALNDPVAGITALSRAGVTFTDQQKSQIKTLVKSGKTLDAQKLIMKEVESQVGGVAAKSSTAGEKMAVFVGNLKEQFGTILLPYLDQFATFFTSTLGPAISQGLSLLGPAIGQVVGLIGPVISKITTLVSGIFGGGGKGSSFAAQLTPIRVAFTQIFGSIQAYAQQVGPTILAIFTQLGGVVQAILPGLLGVINSLVGVARTVGPIVLQVVSQVVSALVANLPTIQAAFTSITQILTSIASIITTVWAQIGPIILPIVTSVFGLLVGVIGGALKIIAGLFQVISAVLKGDWQGAWQGIQQIAQGVIQIVTSQIQAFKSILTTIWNAIKGAATTAWNGIKTAITTAATAIGTAVFNKVSSIKTTMANAWSAIKTAVSTAWSTIVTTVATKIGNVVTKVKELPGKARDALSGIGSALTTAGGNLVQGFINGISGALHFVASKASEIASTAINAAKSALGIASPSKVFKQIGAYVGQGFIKGLQGTQPQVAAAVKRMVGYLQREAKAKGAAGKRARTALKIVNALDNRALAIAKARTLATAKLAAAQAKLNDLIKARADFASSVTKGAQDFASIMGIKLADDLPLTNATLIQGLKERLAAIVNFRAKLDQLKAQGLNATTLQQIIAAGIEGGTEVANTLATGGKSVITEINNLQGRINTQATSLGNTTAGYFYNTGIKAQQGLIKGLTANQKALESAAAQIARTLSNAVKKALKIKSPSKVFAEIGDNVTRGLEIGLDDKLTKRAGAVLAGSLVSGFGSPTLDANAVLAGSQGAPGATYNITVNASPLSSPSEVGRAVITSIKEYEKTSGRRVLVR